MPRGLPKSMAWTRSTDRVVQDARARKQQAENAYISFEKRQKEAQKRIRSVLTDEFIPLAKIRQRFESNEWEFCHYLCCPVIDRMVADGIAERDHCIQRPGYRLGMGVKPKTQNEMVSTWGGFSEQAVTCIKCGHGTVARNGKTVCRACEENKR